MLTQAISLEILVVLHSQECLMALWEVAMLQVAYVCSHHMEIVLHYWTAPTTITNITKLRIYVDMSGTASGGAFEVNGIDYRAYLDSAIYGQITSGEDGCYYSRDTSVYN